MKTLQAAQFFSEAEKEKIREAVASVEKSTAGEIATMVVDRSDSYREADILGAVLLAGFLALIIEVLLEYYVVTGGSAVWSGTNQENLQMVLYGISIWAYIPMAFLLFFPSRLLFRKFPALKLPLIGKKRIEEAVRERAVRAFYEKALYKTRDETGVLIFISLLERKVWILGDRGIDRKIPHTYWQTLVGEITAGLSEAHACEALCAVIRKIGEELARLFPGKSDDYNELSDEILH